MKEATSKLPSSESRLLSFLVRSERITTEEAAAAAEIAHVEGLAVVDALHRRSVVDEGDVAAALSTALRLPLVNLGTTPIDEMIVQVLDEETAMRFGVMPIAIADGELTLAMANPLDLEAVKRIAFTTGLRVRQAVAPRSQIVEAIGRYYRLEDALGTLLEAIPDVSSLQLVAEGSDGDPETSASPVVKMVNLVLAEALSSGASDIHIQPGPNLVQVRYRIHGVLENAVQFPKWIHNFIVGRIKILADLDIAERRTPQDGSLRLTYQERSVDLRVSSLPTKLGEKIVMRILDPERGVRSVDALGLSERDAEVLRGAVRFPEGMVLVTGPTGSGKTTTLYALIRELLSEELNIVTIENPIEYQLDGISQVQVNEKQGLTFASSLRSILRQDPDVILLGEIRDRETAEVAFRAAQTGHLVLSTLHTNDGASTITRLLDLGIEPYLLASSLIAVVGQRLVRTVCTRCSEPVAFGAVAREPFGLPENGDYRRGRGCPGCRQGGYATRTGIYEVIEVTERIRSLIEIRAPESAVREAARQRGTVTLLEDAVNKILKGITTPEEVTRVTQVERRGPKCPGCSKPVEDGFASCPYCFRELKLSCGACGAPQRKEWKRCPYCKRHANGTADPDSSGEPAADGAGEGAAAIPGEEDETFAPPGLSGGDGGSEPEDDAGSETALELSPASRAPGASRPTPGRIDVPRILVVDDHEDLRRIVAWTLRKALGSIEIEEAADGLAAIEKVEARPPHLIVLDIMMPGLDGIEVCRRIRTQLKHALIPIILLTGKSDAESKKTGFLAGTDDYIVKPFQRADLSLRVRRLLERNYGFRPAETPPAPSSEDDEPLRSVS